MRNRLRLTAMVVATGVVLLGKHWWVFILPILWKGVVAATAIFFAIVLWEWMTAPGGRSCRRICDELRCWRVCDDGPQDGGYIGYSHVNEPQRWQ